MKGLQFVRVLVALTGVALFSFASYAQFGDWPAVYNPSVLLTLNLDMDPSDWATVQGDETLDIEVPAMFWADGDTPILISVRRKSGDPLTADPGFVKVSLKLDINEYVVGQSWHGLKKLSLENGDDQDVVSEGLAWQIERMASGTQGYGYAVGHAAWVRLMINSIDTGVYVNVEQVDKRFLENRGLYVEGETWLYKVGDIGGLELEAGGPQDSPTVEALCYQPFDKDGSCPQPDLATHVPQYVNMKGLLTLMASDAFQANGDALLTKGKNFFFADFLGGRKRMYFPWDRDSSLSGGSLNDTVYIDTSAYGSLLTVPEFRAQYNEIFSDLLCGPRSAESLVAFLDAVEPVLSSALAADPNNQLSGTVADHFDSLCNWVNTRVANILGEIEDFQSCPSIQVVLNEFMASNIGFLEDPDEPGEYPDWFELYNPTGTPWDLGGIYLTDDPAEPTKYQIPSGVTIPADGYLVFWADDDGTQGALHLNFNLAAGGEGIYVFDTNGLTLIDSVVFGPQFSDVSYGLYPNGTGTWGFMAGPTPGAVNGPHNAPPMITGTARLPEWPTDVDPVWVTATVTDDSAVAGVTLHYAIGSTWTDVTMNDDGLHQDGVSGDGLYGGQIPAYPNDTLVKYYISAVDNVAGVRTDPLNTILYTYSYLVGYLAPEIFINEFMADNDTFIEDPDQPFAYEDWVELYNGSPVTVDLSGMYLTDDLSSPQKYQIPPGVTIPAGGYLVFWTDDDVSQGPLHTNFKLSVSGESIGLYDSDALGNMPINTLTFGPQTTDISQGRCPDGSDTWVFFSVATPGTANEPCNPTAVPESLWILY